METELLPANKAAPEIRSRVLARHCILVALFFAMLGSAAGCVEVRLGSVRGPEAWLVVASLAVEALLFALAFFNPARASLAAVAGVTYFTFHLSAGVVLSACSETRQLDLLIFLIWFFPLLILNRLVNFNRAVRNLGYFVAGAPPAILLCLLPVIRQHYTRTQLIVVLCMQLSYLLYAAMLTMVTRYREAYIVERERGEALRAEAVVTERLAFSDGLTGLPNRAMIHRRLEEALADARQNHSLGALFFLDLDNFKNLNDTLGHGFGDSLLQAVALRLLANVPPGQTVGRLGGDEFVVLLQGLPSNQADAASAAQTAANRLLLGLRPQYRIRGYECTSTPSIGIALFPQPVDSVNDLLKRADLAMYRAKALGRNSFCLFDPQMQVLLEERAALEADLRLALRSGEFHLVFQPQVDATGRVTGAEALLRWNHPLRGFISPAEFIPVAEDSGLILQIGHWVLHTACKQLARWAASPLTKDLCLSVNISMLQLLESNFVSSVAESLAATHAHPHQLKLELTESAMMEMVEDCIVKMQQIQRLGVRFSLDDFGTGYSSLSQLQRLPLDQIKVDKSFVTNLAADPRNASIAKAIITLAHELGLNVIAEGVETELERDLLLQQGCSNFQGYLYSRPIPIAQFERYLADQVHLLSPADAPASPQPLSRQPLLAV